MITKAKLTQLLEEQSNILGEMTKVYKKVHDKETYFSREAYNDTLEMAKVVGVINFLTKLIKDEKNS